MEQIRVSRRDFDVIKDITKSDAEQVFLVEYKSKQYVLKKYPSFDAYDEALYRYKKLYKCSIYIPTLVRKDKKGFILVFDYIEGEHMDEILAKQDIDEKVFEKLFLLYRYARANQIELNYLPENYVMKGKYLYYTSLDLFDMNKDMNLENYGLEFWIISRKGYDHLTKLGYNVDKKRILSNGETNKKIVLLSLFNW